MFWQRHRIHAIFYTGLSFFLTLLAGLHYLSGYYLDILLPAILSPVFLLMGTLRWQNPSALQPDPLALVAQLSLILLLVLQPNNASDLNTWCWIALIYPVLAFFLAVSLISLCNCLLLLAGLLLIHQDQLYQLNLPSYLTTYLLMTLASWFYTQRSEQRFQRLSGSSKRNPVTGLDNHRVLARRLQAEVERLQSTLKPFALLILELHQYQRLEQEAGTKEAAAFLQDACQILQQNCRIGDEVFHLNTDTLALILPNTSKDGALVLRERLHQQLQQQLFCDLGALAFSLTPITLRPGDQPADFWQRLQAFQPEFAVLVPQRGTSA